MFAEFSLLSFLSLSIVLFSRSLPSKCISPISFSAKATKVQKPSVEDTDKTEPLGDLYERFCTYL